MIDIESNFTLTDSSSSYCVELTHSGSFENISITLPVRDPETTLRELAVDYLSVLYNSGESTHSPYGYRSNSIFEVVIPELDGFYDKDGNEADSTSSNQVALSLNATGMVVYHPSQAMLLTGHTGPTQVLKWHRIKDGIAVIKLKLFDTRYWPDFNANIVRNQITGNGLHLKCLLRVREL